MLMAGCRAETTVIGYRSNKEETCSMCRPTVGVVC